MDTSSSPSSYSARHSDTSRTNNQLDEACSPEPALTMPNDEEASISERTEDDYDNQGECEEWTEEEAYYDDYDCEYGYRPTHLFVPQIRFQPLRGPCFDRVPYPLPPRPGVPHLILTTDEGDHFSLVDRTRYDYDYYGGRYHFYDLDDEDEEAEAWAEENCRALEEMREAGGRSLEEEEIAGRGSNEEVPGLDRPSGHSE